jgi:hypothetical protein
MASKNEEIAKLEDRVSECHAQLAMCRCGNILDAKARLSIDYETPKTHDSKGPASMPYCLLRALQREGEEEG